NPSLIGVLIECDPSVKAIILKYDRLQNNEYIVEDLEGDDRYLVVKESQLASLKIRLAKAWIFTANKRLQELDGKLMQPEESESE
ncbi:hypothetical protein TESG_03316, partial [Trichophyton tonsurans CBS 112818]